MPIPRKKRPKNPYIVDGMINSSNQKYSLVVHEDAESELEALWGTNETVAADIVALLELLCDSQDLLDRLSKHGFVQYHEPAIEISKWVGQQQQKRNLWRLKFVAFVSSASARFRVIYAFHPTQLRYYVLGILDRDFNYEPSHPISKRITAAYDELGIPDY